MNAVHPLTEAGWGKGPYRACTAIRLPLLAEARKDPDVAARRRARIASESALCHVEASRCGECRMPADDLYVISDATERMVGALCKPCLAGLGDPGLMRNAAHLDHEYDRKERRVTR